MGPKNRIDYNADYTEHRMISPSYSIESRGYMDFKKKKKSRNGSMTPCASTRDCLVSPTQRKKVAELLFILKKILLKHTINK